MEESSPRVDPDIEKVRSKTNKTNFNLEFLIVFNYDKTSIKFLGKGLIGRIYYLFLSFSSSPLESVALQSFL